MKTIDTIDLGLSSYEEAYFLQKAVVRGIRQNRRNDCLVLTEHPDVFTIGRSGTRKNILGDESLIRENGVKIIDVDRGGDITFHGKGQLVAYPILDLSRHTKDVRYYIKSLERVLELAMFEYGLSADIEERHTGLWVNGYKIGFIGIGVSHWVTYHGISINANVDLRYFSMIRPCGIDGLRVGSLRDLLKQEIDIDHLKAVLLKKICEVFGFDRRDHTDYAVLAQETASRY